MTSKKVSAAVLESDLDAIISIQALKDYAPMNPAYNAAALAARVKELEQAEENYLHAVNAMAAARDAKERAWWNVHVDTLGAKTQIVAQYGVNSDEVAAVGLKKKEDRKRVSRKAKTL